MWVVSKWLKFVLAHVCMHMCEMSECYLQPEEAPAAQMCLSLWAQHETQETDSLIITYLSLCPPLGPPVTTADAPHWQARNTLANSNTKSRTAMSLTGAGIQTCPPRRYNNGRPVVWAKRVYYSIFGFQLALVTVRLAGVHICIRTNGQFTLHFLWLYVCWVREKQADTSVIKGRTCLEVVSQKQTSFSKFICLTYCFFIGYATTCWENCRQTGRHGNNIWTGSALGRKSQSFLQ